MYQIPDEPVPGRMAHWVVSPSWILLSVMIGGAWLSWPWFLFNAHALGSTTRRRETAWVVGGFLGSICYVYVLFFLLDRDALPEEWRPYLWLVLGGWKTAVSYILYTLQARSFQLHEHFGGVVRNGLIVVFTVGLLGEKILLQLLPHFWRIVLS